MKGRLFIINGATRPVLHDMINRLPDGHEALLREPTRTTPQNSRMWAMLGDISAACPDGRKHPAETWKQLFMHALGYEVQFESGLNGQPFPAGFKSSRLRKQEMADLITFIAEYGDRHGVQWSEQNPYEREAT